MMTCRLCGSRTLERVVDLGHHPLADRFLTPVMLRKPEVTYPLALDLCTACGYVGLAYVVPVDERYRSEDYSYTAGNSPVSLAHFAELARSISTPMLLDSHSLVIDIGGNDGTLLRAFEQLSGCQTINVEPSPNMARLSRMAGTKVIQNVWGEDVVMEISATTPVLDDFRADVIVTTNVLNHASDPCAFVAAVAKALKPDGLFVIEVPSLLALVGRRAFDTIYLEHVSYFGVRSLGSLLERYGFRWVRAEIVDYMGGSIRISARKAERAIEADGATAYLAWNEHQAGLYHPTVYEAFMRSVVELRDALTAKIERIRGQGGRIYGVGAAAKGNTLLNYCKIDRRHLDCIADASPLKIGKYTPGSHIPIVADDDVPADATHALILPWNIADHLREKLQRPGLEFIVPGEHS